MIEIKKGSEPDDLIKLREECQKNGLSPKASFEMLRNPLKSHVIDCLKRDQGHLCVYCMSKIPRADKEPGVPGQSIEHFIPLEPQDGRDIGQGLDYQNLYAVCHGNIKMRSRGTRRTTTTNDLTCDKHRGNIEFRRINPCDGETLKTIFYTMDGRIDASDSDVRYDLINILNLNCESSPIVGERRAVLDELIDYIGEVSDDELKDYCESLLRGFRNETDPRTPCLGLIILSNLDFLFL